MQRGAVSPMATGAATSPPRRGEAEVSKRMRCLSCSDPSTFEENLTVNPHSRLQLHPESAAKRNRSPSVSAMIQDVVRTGTISSFCRTRGHGFILPDIVDKSEKAEHPEDEVFLHIFDVDGDFVPKKGDKVTFRLCPIPPKCEKFQAVHARITEMTAQSHMKWDNPIAPEEREEERARSTGSPYDV